MKRSTIVLAILLIILLLSGCNAGVISNEPSETAAATTTTAQTTVIEAHTTKQTKTTSTTESTTADSTTETTTEAVTEAIATTAATTQATTVTTTESTTSKPTEKTSKEKKEQSTTAKKKKEKTTAATTAAQTVTKSEYTCTLTVECKDIFKNLDHLKDGHERYLPENGYFIKKTAYTFTKGETVYDLLVRAAAENGLKLSTKNTQFGIYISGINNIDEFDVGKELGWTSGWVYYVNGEFATHSCGKYEIKQGDDIVFTYSCNDYN